MYAVEFKSIQYSSVTVLCVECFGSKVLPAVANEIMHAVFFCCCYEIHLATALVLQSIPNKT